MLLGTNTYSATIATCKYTFVIATVLPMGSNFGYENLFHFLTFWINFLNDNCPVKTSATFLTSILKNRRKKHTTTQVSFHFLWSEKKETSFDTNKTDGLRTFVSCYILKPLFDEFFLIKKTPSSERIKSLFNQKPFMNSDRRRRRQLQQLPQLQRLLQQKLPRQRRYGERRSGGSSSSGGRRQPRSMSWI